MVRTAQYPRIATPPPGSFFLFGPRGVGKSTGLRAAVPKAHRIDLLDEALYQAYLADAGAFAGELRALPPEAFVVVDRHGGIAVFFGGTGGTGNHRGQLLCLELPAVLRLDT